MSPPIFVSWDLARRKKYRKYLRYILQSAKKSEKNCGIFCRAQKILQKLAQKQTKKIYDNRKYLQYILRIAKISVNISDIFCKSQKISLKIPQTNEKKLWLLHIWQFAQRTFSAWLFPKIKKKKLGTQLSSFSIYERRKKDAGIYNRRSIVADGYKSGYLDLSCQ